MEASRPERPRVLVTRSPRQGSALADALRALGTEPVLVPAIETVPPTSWVALDAALAELGRFDWVIFTSANAVEAVAPRVHGIAAWPKIAVIGTATARALEGLPLRADLVPPQAVAESLFAALLPYVRRPSGEPAQVLLLRAEQARELLPEALRAAGATAVYDDAEALPPSALRVSIGPVTSQTLRELGIAPDAEAPEATVAALARTVVEALARRGRRA